MRCSARSEGFTLIEILVSLVILSISILGIASLMSTTTKYNASGGRLTEATTFVQDRLEIFTITPYTKIKSTGDVMPGATGISYGRNWGVVANADDTLKVADVTVNWKDGVNHSVSIRSAIAK